MGINKKIFVVAGSDSVGKMAARRLSEKVLYCKVKTVKVSMETKPEVSNGGRPPKHMYDPFLVANNNELMEAYKAAYPVLSSTNSRVGKLIICGTAGHEDSGSFDDLVKNLYKETKTGSGKMLVSGTTESDFFTNSFYNVTPRHLPAIVLTHDCFVLLERLAYYFGTSYDWRRGEFITPFSKFCRDVLGYAIGDEVPAFTASEKYREYLKTNTIKDLYLIKKR
jgi:hypothetical protein